MLTLPVSGIKSKQLLAYVMLLCSGDVSSADRCGGDSSGNKTLLRWLSGVAGVLWDW